MEEWAVQYTKRNEMRIFLLLQQTTKYSVIGISSLEDNEIMYSGILP